MSSVPSKTTHSPVAAHPANRLGLDYAAEAGKLGDPPVPIIDAHSHINGKQATEVYARAADLYGINLTYSMTQLEEVQTVRNVLRSKVRFIAVPNFSGEDRKHHHGAGFDERVKQFYDLGVRIVKFWAAPRGIDYGREIGEPNLLRLNASARLKTMEMAAGLGMMFMTHIADPDTWFTGKYSDASIYGTKAQQYEPFEELLDRFKVPWIAAHMGGWPEDLEFLSGLLSRHDNLYLDTSAAKWMIRELSKHPRKCFVEFLERWQGRIMFGSDIVTTDEHLQAGETKNDVHTRANTTDEAFNLYASRYWALRTLFETDYEGESPIADPDLAMVEPEKYDEMDAPQLSGKSVPQDLLRSLYHDAAHNLLEPLHRTEC